MGNGSCGWLLAPVDGMLGFCMAKGWEYGTMSVRPSTGGHLLFIPAAWEDGARKGNGKEQVLDPTGLGHHPRFFGGHRLAPIQLLDIKHGVARRVMLIGTRKSPG